MRTGDYDYRRPTQCTLYNVLIMYYGQDNRLPTITSYLLEPAAQGMDPSQIKRECSGNAVDPPVATPGYDRGAKRNVMMQAIEDYYGLAQDVGSPLAADLDKIIYHNQSLARKGEETPPAETEEEPLVLPKLTQDPMGRNVSGGEQKEVPMRTRSSRISRRRDA